MYADSERTTPGMKKLAAWINGIAVVVALWSLLIHLPYAISIILCALIPMIAIVIVIFSKGTVVGFQFKRTALPHLTYAMIGPSSILALRTLFDFNVDDGRTLMIPMFAVFILLLLLLIRYDDGIKGRITSYALITPVLLLYSFGLVMAINCIPDKSAPHIYTARVISKYASGGGYRSIRLYYLNVSSWGRHDSENRIPVSRSLYEEATSDMSVDIAVKQGAVGIPWYGVRIHRHFLIE
jgi:hypothetical protein